MKTNLTHHIVPTLVLLGLAAPSFADPPVTLAPPTGQSAIGAPASAGADSVFQWAEVPQNQEVPLTRAVFDQSGYQLYDTAGETIVIPFTNNNLYVMKFAPSTDGTTYFVNTGDAPVLYIPQGGFLENAAVPGARWYPFSADFQPAEPVYLGVAPNWNDFVSIGWAPDLVIRGGYWGHNSFIAGGVFLPSVGVTFAFGGHSYNGWAPYHNYIVGHPGYVHFDDARAFGPGRVFRGAGPGYVHGGGGSNDHDYRGGSGGYTHGARAFRGSRGAYRHGGR